MLGPSCDRAAAPFLRSSSTSCRDVRAGPAGVLRGLLLGVTGAAFLGPSPGRGLALAGAFGPFGGAFRGLPLAGPRWGRAGAALSAGVLRVPAALAEWWRAVASGDTARICEHCTHWSQESFQPQ